MRRLCVIALALLAAGAGGGACAQSLPRAQWASMMRQVMPSAFCQEGTYFRACFAQDAAACVEAAKRSVDECLSQHEAQIPDILKNAEAGSRWSRVIGACAGTLFETHSRKAKRSSARCNNPEAWQ